MNHELDRHKIKQAWQSLQSGDIQLALNIINTIADIEHAPFNLHRAIVAAILIQGGKLERGALILNADWSDSEPEAAGLAGALLFSLGYFQLALPALESALARHAADTYANQVNLGRTLVFMGRAEDGIPHLRQAVGNTSRDNTLALQSLVEALLAVCRNEEALALLPEKTDNDRIARARLVALAMLGRHADAAVFIKDLLQANPDSQSLLLLNAEFAETRGCTTEAVNLIKAALKKEPDNITLWVQLAHLGQKGRSNPEARMAADKALVLSKNQSAELQALALSADAYVLAEDNNLNRAEVTYRKALSLAPQLVPALSGLGQLLMQIGKVDEAIQYFEMVRASAPLQGWSQLIHARHPPEDPNILENMERIARQPSLEGSVKPSLLLTIASAWDKKKEYDRAMILAREANDAAKKILPYKPEEHRKRIELEMSVFSKAFMENRNGWGNTSRLPVFVLGMPRSGTTLTEQILAGHSSVFGAGELSFIPEQIAKIQAWQNKLGSGFHYPECITDLTQNMSQTFSKQILDKLTMLSPDATHVIDKLPHNFEHIGLIKLLFPNVTIFHCQREPRDIAVSNYITDYATKFGGMGFSYDLGWIGEQIVDHNRVMQHWHDLFPGQIMEVPYEDLVEDTEGLARRMIDFLRLEWEPSILDFQSLERQIKTASVWQVRQPVYKTSKERWRHYEKHLSPLEDALKFVPSVPEPLPLTDTPPGLFTEGMSFLQTQNFFMAVQCFLRVIAAHPNHAAAYQFLGVAQLQQGQSQQAIKSMRHSLKLLSIHASWHENLAKAEKYAGNDKAAETALNRAKKLRSFENSKG